MKAAFVAGAAGVAGVAGMIVLLAGCTSASEPQSGVRQTLRPVVLPELTRAAEPVQAQLRRQYASLTAKQNQPDAPDADLGAAYGEMGKLLLAAEFRDQAEAALLNAEALAPGDMRWPYYLGHVYRTKGDIPSSAGAFERALQSAPNDVPTMIWLAEADFDQGRIERAEPLLTKALSLQPRSAAVRYGLGRVALGKQDYARAAEHLEQALTLDGASSRIHYSLAMAYRGLGDAPRAESHLQQVGPVTLELDDDPLMKEIGELLDSALAYENNGKEALSKGDLATAVDFFRKGVALAPLRASVHHQLGTALFLTGDKPGALAEFQEAVRLSPTFAKAHYSLGLMEESAGRHPQAIEHFSAAVDSEPEYAEARLHLANSLRRSGQLEASLSQYEKMLGMDPSVLEARFGYAAALIRLKRYQEARTRLDEAMDRFPEETSFGRAAARLLAAAPDDRVRDGRRAMEIAQLLLKRTPRNIELAETMAMTSAEVGQYADAVDWQQQAIDAAAQAGRRDLAEIMTANLKLYQARRPCRTPWRADEPIEFYGGSGAPVGGPRP